MTRLLYAVTVAASTGFFRGRLGYLRERGFDVHVVSSPGPQLEEIGQREGMTIHSLPMRREPAPLADLVSLFRALRLVRRLRPDLVDAGTPKAGLLFSLAAVLCGVRCRVYSLYGLRLESTKGLLRWLLTRMERVACTYAQSVICVSPSLRQRVIELKLARPEKLAVIGSGGAKGASAERFASNPSTRQKAERLREELRIGEASAVIGFVGRVTRDKGIAELVNAYLLLKPRFPLLTLILIGPFEDGDQIEPCTRQLIESTPGILAVGRVEGIVNYYHMMDILALPTYREGFPSVSLEAAAAGKPVVTTNATGAIDSVVDGVTGFVVPVGDSIALADALGRLLEDPELARRMGEAGRQRVIAEFQPERIWKGVEALYRELLQEEAKAEVKVEVKVKKEEDPPAGRGKGEGATHAYSLKRTLDVFVSAFALLALSPLLAFAALLILIIIGWPVFFFQERPGLRGRPFRLVKLRTMRTGPGTNEERMTLLGQLLRRLSIDELPELWNVLRGDMSLVGPRPLLMEYLSRYTNEQARRHEVRPGVTGWAQVNGRNTITWEQKFALDVWYVDNLSLRLDSRILALTVLKVLKREGISPPGRVTVEKFKGIGG